MDMINAEADSFKAQQERIEANSRDAVAKGKALCVTPSGVDIVGITEFLALIGASASGIRSRRQKVEVDELNEKLRAINQSLTTRSKRNPAGMVAALGYTGAQMAETPVDSPMSASMDEAKRRKMEVRVTQERRCRMIPRMIANTTKRE